jgi:RHS repeat-associated protein
MRRTVWDGPQELVEVHAPGAPSQSALWEQDVGYYPALALDFRSSPPKDPNRYYGQVVYTTGLRVDQPLSIRRLSYADSPDATHYTQWPSFTVIPIFDREGTTKMGVFSDGAWAKQFTPGGTQCAGGTSAQRCVQLIWQESSSAYDMMRGWTPQSYMGSLLEQKRNASGTFFRRARVYDPNTGRFTQEDPIGLAGGLNLYGYANGDPVNFSDSFGLCAGPSDVKCVEKASHTGVLGTMLAGIGGAAQQWWAAHREAVLQIGAALVTEGMSLEGEGLTATGLRGKSMEEVEQAIPQSWTREPSARGGGTRYVHPENKGEQIRVQPGNPNDPNPVKQGPYCRISRCGEKTDPIPLRGNPTLPLKP